MRTQIITVKASWQSAYGTQLNVACQRPTRILDMAETIRLQRPLNQY